MLKETSVLVAEDNQDDVFLLERAFGSATFKPKLGIVRDGEEVIRHLSGITAAELPSLILLDLKMPRRTGHEVLQWIRSQEVLSRIVVLILTSSREPSDIERARELGADSYLIKPGGFNEFRKVIESLNEYWLAHDQFVRLPLLAK